MTSGTTAIVRARYLEEQLRGVLWGELGQAGQRLVEWFGSVLEAMNPSPPPAGARTHLLLDRYGREAREIEFVARRGEKPAQFAVALREMIARETATLRSVLAALDRTEAIRELDVALNDALGQSPEHEIPVDQLGQRFARVRNIVTRSILALAPDGYSLPGAPETTQMIETMILDSSEAVRAAVGR